jgi:hypothetical protein
VAGSTSTLVKSRKPASPLRGSRVSDRPPTLLTAVTVSPALHLGRHPRASPDHCLARRSRSSADAQGRPPNVRGLLVAHAAPRIRTGASAGSATHLATRTPSHFVTCPSLRGAADARLVGFVRFFASVGPRCRPRVRGGIATTGSHSALQPMHNASRLPPSIPDAATSRRVSVYRLCPSG